ncbi:MAG: M20/M25/M40 family metallo-hydrolase [Anaerovoracaceae bacterium]|jgi:arginine utilization protein RocB
MNGFFADIDKDIKKRLFDYVKVQTYTYTEREREAENFLNDQFGEMDYFKAHPELHGTYPIQGDPFGRSAYWAMLKGEGRDTVVMIHHSDIVDVEDFKMLKSLAFSPEELRESLFKIIKSLPRDAQKDLEEDTFLFGRGTADMKGGGAIQITLMERYSKLQNFKGNLIILAVPDEENMSAGMLSATTLLSELQDQYGLDYKLMINSESHQRKDFAKGVVSEGSVGKIMPFVYVRGYLAHAGKVFEGFNPIGLMSKIVDKTELNMDFSDTAQGEVAPPPTWLYLKDSKNRYDVSMPQSIAGCFSILTLHTDPSEIEERVREVCREASREVLEKMKKSWDDFLERNKWEEEPLPWEVKVCNFKELYEEAKDHYGEEFENGFKDKMQHLSVMMFNKEKTAIESNFDLLDFIYNYIDDQTPRVIYGFVPPYYPNVSNVYFKDGGAMAGKLSKALNDFTEKEFGQSYIREHFYTGISDLSYSGMEDGEAIMNSMKDNMPLYGDYYSIPTGDIEKISMPVINIGPWGKDIHKVTERVSKEDLYERTPRIIDKALSMVLGW